jgi:excisionase family DNA binding protein
MPASRKAVSAVPAQTPVTPPEPLLLDLPAAARALSSTVWTVRGLLWRSEIPHIKVGRRFLIDPADLRAFIARRKEAGV